MPCFDDSVHGYTEICEDAGNSVTSTAVYDQEQQLHPAYLLQWSILDGGIISVQLTVHLFSIFFMSSMFMYLCFQVAATGWIGLGWSNEPNTMKGGDIVLSRYFFWCTTATGLFCTNLVCAFRIWDNGLLQ
jgi:hypothetical protein